MGVEEGDLVRLDRLMRGVTALSCDRRKCERGNERQERREEDRGGGGKNLEKRCDTFSLRSPEEKRRIFASTDSTVLRTTVNTPDSTTSTVLIWITINMKYLCTVCVCVLIKGTEDVTCKDAESWLDARLPGSSHSFIYTVR